MADKNKTPDDSARDEFWDIDYITPKRRQSPYGGTPAAADIVFGQEKKETSSAVPTRSERLEKAREVLKEAERKAAEPELEYQPDNSLIKNVRICRWPSSYTFYEKFLTDAMRYYRVKCGESPYVPFFSYLPQYNQMNIDQLRYYIWWRRNLRHSIFLKTDYSYIFLYLYEIINLNTVSTPEKRLDAMCTLWLAYRESFPKLDRYIGEWMCDFCLIHMLPPPLERLSGILEDVTGAVTLREFYLSGDVPVKDTALLTFIKRNTTYKYENSSVYTAKNKEYFDKHIYSAVVYAIEKTEHIKDGEATLSHTCVSRASYNGALCVYDTKRRIDVEYMSLNRTYRFRGLVTSFVKCAENNLRLALGMKSRLSTPGLSDSAKEAVAEYFAKELPASSVKPVKPKTEEDIRYELYDTPKTELSFDGAAKIEEKSWELTGELVSEDETELDDIITECADTTGQEPVADEEEPYKALCALLSPSQRKILTYLADGDTNGAKQVAAQTGLLADAVISAINELAADITGDIVIEDFTIIEDYVQEINSALGKA